MFARNHAPGIDCAECGRGSSTSRPPDPDTLKRQRKATAETPLEALRGPRSRMAAPRVHGHQEAAASA